MKRIISCLIVPTCLAIFASCAVAAQPAVVLRGDLKSRADDTGIVLYYDDGTSEGKSSTAGSGHAVLFRAAEGSWLLDAVHVFGARYGTPQPPDEDFQPVHEFARPYALFERGDLQWVTVEVGPAPVPPTFYLCISFNLTATKGV